ncbi:MAG: tetratricopeptide repeat protein, partial [Pseudomonadota bacterium]
MHQRLRRLPVSLAAPALIILSLCQPVIAADDDGSDASAHVLQAELALHRQDYREASREYRMAAELSESADIARQATRIATSYGFNEDALKSAERWNDLDKDSNEALFYLARLQLRADNLRAARKSYKRLIERADGPPEEGLLTLIGVITEENPESADAIMRWLAKPYRDSAEANYAVAVTALQAGDDEHARERVEKAIEIDPDWLKPRLLYGRVLLVQGDTDKAV